MLGQAQFVWEQNVSENKPFYLIDKWYVQYTAPWPSSSPPGIIKFHSNAFDKTDEFQVVFAAR